MNLRGGYFTAQAAARAMVAGGSGGRIVFTTSVAGVQAIRGLGAYGATKAGLQMLARTLAVELGPHGITVNAVGPGATLTDRTREETPDYEGAWSAVVPTGRVGQVDDVAAAVLFLASAEARHVTGQTLMVDGGWTVTSPTPPDLLTQLEASAGWVGAARGTSDHVGLVAVRDDEWPMMVSTGSVELTIPGDARFLRVARMVASSVASLSDFDVDAVDDLRIAVDELCGVLVERGGGSAIELRFDVVDGTVVVRGTCALGAEPVLDGDREALWTQILAVVTDRYEVTAANGELAFVLEKRSGAAGVVD